MLKHYLATAIRNLLRYKTYSLINITGLAVGMACCILILNYIHYEFTWDTQHTKSDQIHRLIRETKKPDGRSDFKEGTSSGALAQATVEGIPEVEGAARFKAHWLSVGYKDKLTHRQLAIVDPTFFDIFDFRLRNGESPQTILQQPGTILLTARTVHRLFDNEDPIGKTVTIRDKWLDSDYIVAGVLEDYPPNSSVRFDFITTHAPQTFYQTHWTGWEKASWRRTKVFLSLQKNAQIDQVESKLQEILARHLNAEDAQTETYHLQPLTDIHLYSAHLSGLGSSGDVAQVRLFAIIGGLILLIACVNFVNLSTARATTRAREVGVRKVAGAHRSQLIAQFMGEAILVTGVAALLATFLAHLGLSEFNAIVGRPLILSASILLVLPALVVSVGLVAGCYPALYLSQFTAVIVLKNHKTTWGAERLRKGLVLFQFVVSILLIIGTMTVYQQLNYISEKDLGYNKDHVVELWLLNQQQSLRSKQHLVKEQFLRHPNVVAGTLLWGGGVVRPTEYTVKHDNNETISAFSIGADSGLLETYDIELIAGQNIRDKGEGQGWYLINETMARALGMGDPIGQPLQWIEYKQHGTIVGVVRDFHFHSLHHPIRPLFIRYSGGPAQLNLRIRPNNVSETRTFLEKTWHELAPDIQFNYRFLDSRVDAFYREERRVSQMAIISASLATFVACLGLLGLAAFAAERRWKEIGIRKVLGASVGNVMRLLVSESVKLVALANVIAWPIAYVVMQEWLNEFAFRVNTGIGTYLIISILSLMLAVGIVILQTLKAATANPVDTLRSE